MTESSYLSPGGIHLLEGGTYSSGHCLGAGGLTSLLIGHVPPKKREESRRIVTETPLGHPGDPLNLFSTPKSPQSLALLSLQAFIECAGGK